MVYFNFKTGKRIENNLAETKPVFRNNYIVVGTDSKGKSFRTRVDNVTLVEARQDAKSWAKSHGLTVDVVRALK
jgi:hypothetical protein